MRKKNSRSLCLIASLFLLTACNQKTVVESTTATTSAESVERVAGKYGKYSQKDLTVATSAQATTQIELKDQQTKIAGKGAEVTEDVVTITEAGIYEITGSLKEGQLVIAADKANDDVQILLNGVTITNSQTSPFYVKSANKVIVTLAEDSHNQFNDGKDYTFEEGLDEPDATIFSKADLTFNGSGKLQVTAKYKDAIRSKDDLVFVSGNYEITAANNGLKGNDSVSVLAGDFIIEAKNDGIQASTTNDETLGWIAIDEGNFKIQTEHDGLQAETALLIASAQVKVTTGGGAEAAEKKTAKNDGMGEPGMGGELPEMNGEPPTMNGEKPEMPEGQSETTARSFDQETANQQEKEEETTGTTESNKGLKAGTTIQIDRGEFILNTTDDSLHANQDVTIENGSFTIASGDDGIHANQVTTIRNGTFNITESYEGIEGGQILIQDGTITVNSSDDGINAASSELTENMLTIDGGEVYVNAEGDGIDSNGDVVMTGGTLLVDGPTTGGNGALDYDGIFKQTGGTLVAVGSSGMAMATSQESTQPALSLYFDSNQKAGNLINISDTEGKIILTYQPTKDYQHAVISSPEFKLSETYSVSTGGKDSGEKKSGLFTDSQYTGEELLQIELSGTVTSVSETGETVSQNQMGGPQEGGFNGEGNREPK